MNPNLELTRDECSSLAHALDHLNANKIAEAVGRETDWYLGNREQFVARHKKAIKLLESMLAAPNRSCLDCKNSFSNPFDQLFCSMGKSATRPCKDFTSKKGVT